MVKRKASGNNEEPEQKRFDLPSEKEHLFQVVDIFTCDDETGQKMGLDADTVSVKCEVCGGDEEGRTLLQRLSLDDKWKGFFATRLFLKACGLPYMGDEFPIDTDEWPGCQFYATVVHVPSKDKSKTFANVDKYNFDKKIDNSHLGNKKTEEPKKKEDIAWDE